MALFKSILVGLSAIILLLMWCMLVATVAGMYGGGETADQTPGIPPLHRGAIVAGGLSPDSGASRGRRAAADAGPEAALEDLETKAHGSTLPPVSAANIVTANTTVFANSTTLVTITNRTTLLTDYKTAKPPAKGKNYDKYIILVAVVLVTIMLIANSLCQICRYSVSTEGSEPYEGQEMAVLNGPQANGTANSV